MAVEFARLLRGQARFSSVDELITAMHQDVATAREVLAADR
jgi:FAD synthase